MSDDVALAALHRMRERCIWDPFFLATEILGYGAASPEKPYLDKPCEFHRDMADAMLLRFECTACALCWVYDDPRKGACPGCGVPWKDYQENKKSVVRRVSQDFLALGPRIHLKTTLKSVVGDIHAHLADHDTRIAIAQATLEKSKKVLGEITGHFVKKDGNRLRGLFPKCCPDTRDEMPNMDKWTPPCRRSAAKEESFTCITQDTPATGDHYDIIDWDDVVYRENVPPASTVEQMHRTWEWVRTFPMLLDQTRTWRQSRGSGTRWNLADAHGKVLALPDSSGWRKIVADVYDERGEPIWPEMYSKAELEKIRADVGEYWWAACFRNNPMPAEESALFRRGNFKPFTFDGLRKDNVYLRIAITVDLAISDGSKPKSDRTAIVVSGISQHGDLYVLEAAAGRWLPRAVLDRLYDMDKMWAPAWIGVEAVAFQKMMIWALHEEGIRRGRHLPVRSLMPDGSKVRRAEVLSSFASARGIYVREDDPGTKDMIEELLAMTMMGTVAEHEDFVDALGYRLQSISRPDATIEAPAIRGFIPGGGRESGADVLERIYDTEKDPEGVWVVE